MKLTRLPAFLLGCLLALPQTSMAEDSTHIESAAFFYAPNIPVKILGQYQYVILEADNVKQGELTALKQEGAKAIAYVSIGEISPTRKWYKEVDRSWVLGKNNIWDSEVMDLNNEAWHSFIIDRLVTPLYEQGYQGIFLDTLDSFNLFAKDEESQQRQIKGLTRLLSQIREKHPEIKLFANRGFEIMSQVGQLFDAVVAESLYASWDNTKKIYKNVKSEDSQWLLGKLKQLQEELALSIIIIDYVAPSDVEEAKKVAEKIKEQGFIPWIAAPALDNVGVGAIKPAINTFLVPFDSKQHGQDPEKTFSELVKQLEAKQLQAHFSDIQTGFFAYPIQGRFKGIINTLDIENQPDYKQWLAKHKRQGVVIKNYQTKP